MFDFLKSDREAVIKEKAEVQPGGGYRDKGPEPGCFALLRAKSKYLIDLARPPISCNIMPDYVSGAQIVLALIVSHRELLHMKPVRCLIFFIVLVLCLQSTLLCYHGY